jgi:dihydrolipoamide dehydrogenase
MSEEMYDVVVMGGGAGGIPAAIRSAQLGGKVAIVESGDLGGHCMNRGCIPFGHMMRASRIIKSLTLGREMGLNAPGISINYPALIRRQEDLISFMRQGVRTALRKNQIKLIEGRGRIGGKGTLEVDGNKVLFKKLIIATGAQWRKPLLSGPDLEGVVNTDFLLITQTPPQRVLLFGESSFLIEIAQFLARLGSQVILATTEKSLLSRESKTIASRLRKVLREEGIDIRTHAAIEKVTKKEDGITVARAGEAAASGEAAAEEVVADALVTLERAADLAGIGVKNIGLDEAASCLAINEKTETAAEGVYAIGDITAPSDQQYSHRAAHMGIVAAENAMGKKASFNPGALIRVLFTHPEVASIGLTPKEARAKGHEIAVGAAPLAMNALGMILAENEGIVEVVADRAYGEILGVHIIGTAASEMIGGACMAIQLEATLNDLAHIPFPHPTLSESLAEAARDALGNPIYLP